MRLARGGKSRSRRGGVEDILRPLHLHDLLLGGIVRDPGTFLLVGGAEEALGTLHGLDIQVGNVRLAVRELEADLAVGRQHEVVLGEATLAVKDGHDALLHGHLTLVKAPGRGIILAVLATPGLGNEGDAATGMGHATRLTAVDESLLLGGRHVGVLVVVVVHLVVVVLGRRGLVGRGRRGQVVLLERLVDTGVVLNLGEALGVDGLGGVLLLDDAQDTVVEMLVKVLGVGEGLRAGAALAGGVGGVAGELLAGVDGGGGLLAAVGRRLFDAVHRGQVALEDVGAVKRLFGGRAGAGAETADHGALVMGQGVAVLVVLAREALDVVLAGLDGALFGALGLVGEHVCL